MMQRTDNLGYSRQSPGLALGSMDLSVTRSPRNGNQNGEIGAPISLSVRDATKINSLDSAEITKIHQVPSYLDRKALEMNKPSSPTLITMNQSSNSPKSPKSTKRPVKKVDSILERLNSMGDGVVITPIQLTPSPHSVIVSAHSLEDSNSRGSSSSVNIIPLVGITPYPLTPHPCERVTPPASHYPPALLNTTQHNNTLGQLPAMPHSVIIESSTVKDDTTLPSNCSNEDSNSSSSDSSRSKRRRKQLKTSKFEHDNPPRPPLPLPLPCSQPPASSQIVKDETDSKIIQTPLENHTSDISRVQEPVPLNIVNAQPVIVNTNSSIESKEEKAPVERRFSSEDNSVPVVSKTRRKNSSESETIDNIAAMIASTENADPFPKLEESGMGDGGQSVTPMQTEQLKQVLGSPGPEAEAEPAPEPVEDKTIPPIEPPPEDITPLRIKRNSISNLENSQDEVPEDIKPEPDATESKPLPKVESQTSFVEVENELEKMFAGIEEEAPNSPSKTLDPVTGLMMENNTADENLAKKKGKAPEKKKRASRRNSVVSTGVLSSDESTPKKKRKSSKRSLGLDEQFNNLDAVSGVKKSKNLLNNSKVKRDKSKEKCKLELLSHKDAYDSGSNASSSKSRGPYVQIKGPRDSPLSVSVINTPMHEEDADKPLQKVKHLKSKSSVNSDSDFRNKVKSKGLHSSTLSMKYDATTTDTSWICVFCKRGPHTGSSVGSAPEGMAQHMGDLFGPYIISTECPDYASMISDPHDTLFKSKVKPGTFFQNRQAKLPGRKVKAEPDLNKEVVKLPSEELFLGMTEASSTNYEVWVHEDCAVWAPGLYLVGAKMVGLDAAVWGCSAVRCQRCRLPGASVTCVRRGCGATMHVNCARADLWSLSEDDFMVNCKEHSLP